MDRRADALIVTVALAACRASQPMHMSVEDKWTPTERAQIVHDMDRWQVATNHIVKFVVSPVPFHDPDGFDREDLDDGVNVVYKIDNENAAADWLQQSTGEELLGYNFDTGDIIIFSYRVFNLAPVVTHELGHHIGLGHVRTHPAIMNDLDMEDCITQWDLEAFCQIYSCNLDEMHPECVMPP
jgi:hypothetical protein